MRITYNKPCKICGSIDQVLFDDEDRKSIFCNSCNHYEDIYVSDELKQYWEDQAKAEEQEKIQQSQNVPKCPTCSSTNVEKISGTAKVAGAVAFGLFSKTARSQFKCKNCGYLW
jgi:phage/plasmid primase-like uncharacterized protein